VDRSADDCFAHSLCVLGRVGWPGAIAELIPVRSGSVNTLDTVRIAIGLVVLVGGGELLVRGASGLAVRWGLKPLVVGLTVVAVGTSAPEFAVTVDAVLRDQTALAVGNVVGSNITNVLLVLGLAAVVLPLAVNAQIVRIELPVMIVLSVLLLILALDGRISALDGLLLLSLWLAHTAMTVVLGRRDTAASSDHLDQAETATATATPTADQGQPETPKNGCASGESGSGVTRRPSSTVSGLLIVAGIALLVAGASVLVTGAVNTATSLGVDGLVIGLTVVALGTSLPELVTSMVAAFRGERDIAIGNVVGSCIANIGLVLAVPAMFANGGIPVPAAAIALDIPLMVVTAVAVLPIVFTGYTVQRWEGALFVALYVAFTTYLVLNATGHQALAGFTRAMVFFVLPLMLVTLITTLVYDLHRRVTTHQAPAKTEENSA
jgi:cation:H+ antiporter